MNDEPQYPPAYLITFSCYGARLHGDERGSVDWFHNEFSMPSVKANPFLKRCKQRICLQPANTLDRTERFIVLSAIKETCQHRKWHLFAAHVRSNHVHIVLQAKSKPEFALTQIKAYATRALKKDNPKNKRQKFWTRHGSTRYIWCEKFIYPAFLYVVEEQGLSMAVYEDKKYRQFIEEHY